MHHHFDRLALNCRRSERKRSAQCGKRVFDQVSSFHGDSFAVSLDG